jgi:hypothetical protein
MKIMKIMKIMKTILSWVNNKIEDIKDEYTIPSNNKISRPDRYNIATELIIQAACFYIGVALFIGLCLIPPFVIILPYALPLTFMICIIANISFVTRFSEGTMKVIDEKQKDIRARFKKNIDVDGALDTMDTMDS